MVTGRITDASDGMPVQGAYVFIAHTTIYTVSDASGNYSFTVSGRGSFEVVFSHIGYQSVFHKIDTPQDTHQYNAELETVELDEIVIMAAKTYRQCDVNLFWRMILGEMPSKRGMEILNQENVFFYKSGNILKASCREPVEIINHHTGYRIRYVLQSFEHDYRSNKTEFYGMPHFEEIVSQNSREQEIWEKKRGKVYAVSLNRFLRALYRKQILEEGFNLVTKQVFLPVPLENILQVEPDVVQLNIEEPLMLFCYSQSITDQMIRDTYHTWLNRSEASAIPIQELLPTQITVYSDGTYSGTLHTRVVNQYMNGLLSMVPVEYPEITKHNF